MTLCTCLLWINNGKIPQHPCTCVHLFHWMSLTPCHCMPNIYYKLSFPFSHLTQTHSNLDQRNEAIITANKLFPNCFSPRQYILCKKDSVHHSRGLIRCTPAWSLAWLATWQWATNLWQLDNPTNALNLIQRHYENVTTDTPWWQTLKFFICDVIGYLSTGEARIISLCEWYMLLLYISTETPCPNWHMTRSTRHSSHM